LAQQDDILDGLGIRQNLGIYDPAGRFGTSVLNYVTSKLRHQERNHERGLLLREIINAIRSTKSHDGTEPPHLSVPENVRKVSLRALLSSLRYNLMKDREGRIADAHQYTFQWLFTDTHEGKWANFKDWLESDSKLYWITGKAGSGKSTLMKYICSPVEAELHPLRLSPWNAGYSEQWPAQGVPRCHEHLRRWSGIGNS
jgi:hypothetical protein